MYPYALWQSNPWVPQLNRMLWISTGSLHRRPLLHQEIARIPSNRTECLSLYNYTAILVFHCYHYHSLFFIFYTNHYHLQYSVCIRAVIDVIHAQPSIQSIHSCMTSGLVAIDLDQCLPSTQSDNPLSNNHYCPHWACIHGS